MMDLMNRPQVTRYNKSELEFQIAHMHKFSTNLWIFLLFVPRFSCINSSPSSAFALNTLMAFWKVNGIVLLHREIGFQRSGRAPSHLAFCKSSMSKTMHRIRCGQCKRAFLFIDSISVSIFIFSWTWIFRRIRKSLNCTRLKNMQALSIPPIGFL